MGKRRLERVQVVYKKSAYELYAHKYRDPKILSLLEAEDPSVQWMQQADRENQQALQRVKDVLKSRGIQVRWSYRAKKEGTQGADLVLAVGGDGTLLEAARMIQDRTPLMGLHSTPTASIGYLCADHVYHVDTLLDQFQAGELAQHEVIRMETRCNGQPVGPMVLNDVLFASPSPAATTHYRIIWNQHNELHRSSGVWIATAVGSTAAIRSAGGEIQPLQHSHFQFRVREAYQIAEQSNCIHGLIAPEDTFSLTCRLRKAHLYFDGPWAKHAVEYGDVITFHQVPTPLVLMGGRRTHTVSL